MLKCIFKYYRLGYRSTHFPVSIIMQIRHSISFCIEIPTVNIHSPLIKILSLRLFFFISVESFSVKASLVYVGCNKITNPSGSAPSHYRKITKQFAFQHNSLDNNVCPSRSAINGMFLLKWRYSQKVWICPGRSAHGSSSRVAKTCGLVPGNRRPFCCWRRKKRTILNSCK